MKELKVLFGYIISLIILMGALATLPTFVTSIQSQILYYVFIAFLTLTLFAYIIKRLFT